LGNSLFKGLGNNLIQELPYSGIIAGKSEMRVFLLRISQLKILFLLVCNNFLSKLGVCFHPLSLAVYEKSLHFGANRSWLCCPVFCAGTGQPRPAKPF
jgi:hypothetical protein